MKSTTRTFWFGVGILALIPTCALGQAGQAESRRRCVSAVVNPISYGDYVECRHPGGTTPQSWQFQATAGDIIGVVAVRLPGGANTSPSLELQSPPGTPAVLTRTGSSGGVFARPNLANSQGLSIPVSGTYTISITAPTSGIGAFEYSLIVERLVSPSVSASLLKRNEITPVERINPEGDRDLHSFFATEGDQVTIRMEKAGVNGTPGMWITNHVGGATWASGGSSATHTFTPRSTGLYSVWATEVNDDGVLEYTLLVTCSGLCPSGTPTIESVTRASGAGVLIASNQEQILRVSGRGFLANHTITVRGPDGAPLDGIRTVDSAPDGIRFLAVLARPGSHTIQVINTDSRSPSNEFAFSVADGNPATAAPSLTRISPNSVGSGSGDVALTIQGDGFVPESTINWNQIALATTYVNAKEMRATIGRQLLANPVSASISVSNGSQRSNLVGFLVSAPTPPKPVPNVSGMIEPKQLAFPAPTGAIVDGAQDALFWIRNTGDQPFPFRVEVKRGDAWLTLSAANNPPVNRIEGTVQPQSAIGVTARTTFNRLSLPNEDGLISVVYGPGLQAETEINVRAGSLNKPEILLSRSRIKVLATKAEFDKGDIRAVPFHILNLGTTPLQWVVEASPGWLSANPSLPPNASGLLPVTGSTGAFPVQSVNLQIDLRELKRISPAPPYRGVVVVRDLNRPDVAPRRVDVDLEIGEGIEVSVAPTGFLFTGDVSAPIEAQNLTVQSLVDRPREFQLQPSELWNTLFGRPCEPPCVNSLGPGATVPFAIRPVTLPADHEAVVTPITANLNIGFNASVPTSVPSNRGGSWFIEGLVVRRSIANATASASVPRKPSGGVRPAAVGCAATLHIVTTGLPNNFFAVRTKLQRFELRVANGCGDFVDLGTVIAIPSNGDPPVRLSPIGKGGWEGNWQPARATGSRPVRIDIFVSTPDGAEGRRSIEGTITPEADEPAAPTTPVVLNAASLRDENVVTPGSIITIVGTDFLDRDGFFQANTDRLPTTLAGVSVFLGDVRLPLLQAVRGAADSSGTPIDQINAIVPYDLPVGQQLVLSVERNGLRSAPAELLLANARPSFFRTNGANRVVVAFDQQNTPITESNRTERGKQIVFHATGLGRVTAPPALGERAKSEPQSQVIGEVRVWFGGDAVRPTSAGLAPGQVGIYQINVAVPESVRPDNGMVEVAIEVDGVRGPSSVLPVLPSI